MKFAQTLLASAACLSVATQPVFAQEMMETGDDTSMSSSDDDDNTPETLLAYLGLSALDGTTTVGEGTGEIEGYMIATAIARKAAKVIVDDVAANLPPSLSASAIILRSDKQKFDLTPYFTVAEFRNYLAGPGYDGSGSITGEVGAMTAEAKLACVPALPKLTKENQIPYLIAGTQTDSLTTDSDTKKEPAFELQASDVFGLLRADNALSSVKVTLGEQALTNALLKASKGKSGKWIIPEEISYPTGGGDLVRGLAAAKIALKKIEQGAVCETGFKLDDAVKKKFATRTTPLLAQLKAIETPKDNKPSLLHNARLTAAFVEKLESTFVLRYSVDKSGGTLVNTSNIFTKLGWPGITMRGGMVVSYRLVDTNTGISLTSGDLICRMPKKLLQTITSKPIDHDKIECDPA